jgi:hypothetical protein
LRTSSICLSYSTPIVRYFAIAVRSRLLFLSSGNPPSTNHRHEREHV